LSSSGARQQKLFPHRLNAAVLCPILGEVWPKFAQFGDIYLGWYCLSWLVLSILAGRAKGLERGARGAMCEDRLSPPACGDVSPARGSRAIAADDRRTVTILLCTLNGERFLAEQLASLERQTFENWKLIASDDGSTDRTKSILRCFPEILRARQG
jgi:hypothetical protein